MRATRRRSACAGSTSSTSCLVSGVPVGRAGAPAITPPAVGRHPRMACPGWYARGARQVRKMGTN
eukprot:11423673-Alexandrium_andersonii.AAC.1